MLPDPHGQEDAVAIEPERIILPLGVEEPFRSVWVLDVEMPVQPIGMSGVPCSRVLLDNGLDALGVHAVFSLDLLFQVGFRSPFAVISESKSFGFIERLVPHISRDAVALEEPVSRLLVRIDGCFDTSDSHRFSSFHSFGYPCLLYIYTGSKSSKNQLLYIKILAIHLPPAN